VVGLIAFAIGAWGVVYSCNSATAACKGAAPWPGLEGTLNRVGWVLVVAGLLVVLASIVAAIGRAVRRE
jgi:hypothetical protein